MPWSSWTRGISVMISLQRGNPLSDGVTRPKTTTWAALVWTVDGSEKPSKASEKAGQGIRTVLSADCSHGALHGGSETETLGARWETRPWNGMTVVGIGTRQALEVEWTVWTTVSTWKVRDSEEPRIPVRLGPRGLGDSSVLMREHRRRDYPI